MFEISNNLRMLQNFQYDFIQSAVKGKIIDIYVLFTKKYWFWQTPLNSHEYEI